VKAYPDPMKTRPPDRFDPPAVWHRADGTVISCVEKIKVLNENLTELRQMAQDAFEDALLLECPAEVIRAELHKLIDSLADPWVEGRAAASKDAPDR
jgi:hypothetical protein